jgi:hypothetical protein
VGALIAALQLLRVLRQLDPNPRYPLVLEDGDDYAEDPFVHHGRCDWIVDEDTYNEVCDDEL